MCVDPRLLEKSMMGIFFMPIAPMSLYSPFISPLISPLLLVFLPFSAIQGIRSFLFFYFHDMT